MFEEITARELQQLFYEFKCINEDNQYLDAQLRYAGKKLFDRDEKLARAIDDDHQKLAEKHVDRNGELVDGKFPYKTSAEEFQKEMSELLSKKHRVYIHKVPYKAIEGLKMDSAKSNFATFLELMIDEVTL